jgi:peptidoglycan hydrolase FlgJ
MDLRLSTPAPLAVDLARGADHSERALLAAANAPRGANAAAQTAVTPEMRQMAEQFEAMVLSEMLAPMFENLDTDGLGGGGAGERMFRPMLIQEYAGAMSKAGGVGIADSIVRELTRVQVQDQAPDRAQDSETDGADR